MATAAADLRVIGVSNTQNLRQLGNVPTFYALGISGSIQPFMMFAKGGAPIKTSIALGDLVRKSAIFCLIGFVD